MRRAPLASLLFLTGCTATQLSQVSQPQTNHERVQFSVEGETSLPATQQAQGCDADCQRRRQAELALLQQLHEPVPSELNRSDSLLLPEPDEVSSTTVAQIQPSLASARAEALKPPTTKARAKTAVKRHPTKRPTAAH